MALSLLLPLFLAFSFFTIELRSVSIKRMFSYTSRAYILILSLGDDRPANHIITLFVAKPPNAHIRSLYCSHSLHHIPAIPLYRISMHTITILKRVHHVPKCCLRVQKRPGIERKVIMITVSAQHAITNTHGPRQSIIRRRSLPPFLSRPFPLTSFHRQMGRRFPTPR
ncbi:hypothetical protein F5888DRAFT_1394421 [Russula emetica]|nr:hypothetical protein F5888DRAFT_1394421 [Russula emetica]